MIGLGCMRLSTEADRDEARGRSVVAAALAGGVTLFDTAHAYGADDADAGHNERLVASVVTGAPGIRVITKIGMRRDGWMPDGRASSIVRDARASAAALGGVKIDVLLLHAIDPKTPLSTSVRALAQTMNDDITRAIGLSNVSRTELKEALRIAPIAAVEVALGAFDDAPVRSGLVRLCGERGIEVLAHSPLGGTKRAGRLARDVELVAIAKDVDATPAELVLAYLVHVHPAIVPLPGARRVESAASVARANALALGEATLLRLDARFPALGALRRPPVRPKATSREVVMIMGLPGAGKSHVAASARYERHERLNRDERGGTLRALARELDARLAAGAERLVLDNTYVTRQDRHDVIAIAQRHGARVRGVFIDVPLAEAQTNVVLRMLRRYGELLGPDAIAARAKSDANMIRPTVLFRMKRALESPSLDEGFDELEIVPFAREAPAEDARAGAVVAIEAVSNDLVLREDAAAIVATAPDGAPWLLLAWRPDATAEWIARARALAEELASVTGRDVDLGLCVHAGGPPACWCRPPLPGLWLEFAERRRVDARKSVLVSGSAAHGAMGRALGMR